MRRAYFLEKKRWLAGLLAFLVPGAGHMAQGRFSKGLLLLFLSVLDIAAMIYYPNATGGRHLMLIVYLGLALPAIYFYSVYDALQHNFRAPGQSSRYGSGAKVVTAWHGLGLSVIVVMLLLFIHPPAALIPWLHTVGDYAPGIGMVVLGLWLLWRFAAGASRLGRITASLLSIAIGALLMWDERYDGHMIVEFVNWWPMILIVFGLDITTVSIVLRKLKRRLSIDLIGLTMAIMAASSAYGVTQFADLPFRWLDQFMTESSELDGYTEESGYRFSRPPLYAELEEAVERIDVVNPNGQVHIRSGAVSQVQIEATVWIDLPDEKMAEQAADATSLDIVAKDNMLRIEGKGESYGEERVLKPRINLVITVPETRPAPYETMLGLKVKTINGGINVHNLSLPGGLSVENTWGKLNIQRVLGDVAVTTKSGDIRVADIAGAVKLDVSNGNITGYRIAGQAAASVIYGNIQLTDIQGEVETKTKNGSIVIHEAKSAVNADTLNGGIEVRSSVVGGSWHADSAIGEIRLVMPEDSDVSVEGSVTFGDIFSDLPLTIDNRTIRGQIGMGTYDIHVNANSNIVLEKNQQ